MENPLNFSGGSPPTALQIGARRIQLEKELLESDVRRHQSYFSEDSFIQNTSDWLKNVERPDPSLWSLPRGYLAWAEESLQKGDLARAQHYIGLVHQSKNEIRSKLARYFEESGEGAKRAIWIAGSAPVAVAAVGAAVVYAPVICASATAGAKAVAANVGANAVSSVFWKLAALRGAIGFTSNIALRLAEYEITDKPKPADFVSKLTWESTRTGLFAALLPMTLTSTALETAPIWGLQHSGYIYFHALSPILEHSMKDIRPRMRERLGDVPGEVAAWGAVAAVDAAALLILRKTPVGPAGEVFSWPASLAVIGAAHGSDYVVQTLRGQKEYDPGRDASYAVLEAGIYNAYARILRFAPVALNNGSRAAYFFFQSLFGPNVTMNDAAAYAGDGNLQNILISNTARRLLTGPPISFVQSTFGIGSLAGIAADSGVGSALWILGDRWKPYYDTPMAMQVFRDKLRLGECGALADFFTHSLSAIDVEKRGRKTIPAKNWNIFNEMIHNHFFDSRDKELLSDCSGVLINGGLQMRRAVALQWQNILDGTYQPQEGFWDKFFSQL